MIDAYPLSWPPGWKRAAYRKNSTFKVSSVGADARKVLYELKLLGASNVVISTNLELRRDGLPYADQRQPEDGGVAVYFAYKGAQRCFACDTYRKIQENLVAIAKTIEALRGMERWGASQMMERVFEGFNALPAKTGRNWWDVLQVRRDSPRETIEVNFKSLLRSRHPDAGGSHEAMSELNQARAEALAQLQP